MRTATRISLFSVLLSLDEITVGIAYNRLPTTDKDDAADEPVDPGFNDRMDAVIISANERFTADFDTTFDDALSVGRRTGMCCCSATAEVTWQQVYPGDRDMTTGLRLFQIGRR